MATSFITDILTDGSSLSAYNVTIYASKEVCGNLMEIHLGQDSTNINLQKRDVHGIESLWPRVSRQFAGFDLVFTIFGPLYSGYEIKCSIVGFAQAWIVYPENEVYFRKSFFRRCIDRLRFELQWLFFCKSDVLVVETESLKKDLSLYRKFDSSHIKVVPNCVAQVFTDNLENSSDIQFFERSPGVVYLGLVSRDYIHKNLDFLLDVLRCLNRIGRLEYKFVVTFTEREWMNKSPEFRLAIINTGVIAYEKLPDFYRQLDGVVFPSLLESFSVTPLEALASRKPLFSSQRAFVSDICGAHAYYFDPLDPDSAAEVIIQWFEHTSEPAREAFISAAHDHYMKLPTSSDRTQSYINLILETLGDT